LKKRTKERETGSSSEEKRDREKNERLRKERERKEIARLQKETRERERKEKKDREKREKKEKKEERRKSIDGTSSLNNKKKSEIVEVLVEEVKKEQENPESIICEEHPRPNEEIDSITVRKPESSYVSEDEKEGEVPIKSEGGEQGEELSFVDEVEVKRLLQVEREKALEMERARILEKEKEKERESQRNYSETERR